MKVIIAGGTGHVGAILSRHFSPAAEVVLLSRRPSPHAVAWDGRQLGPWAKEIDGADVVINLAGRSVNCRYHAENLRQMMDSRVESTRVIGEAIASAKRPPRLWLQASTATIYAHRFDAPNDEATGILGGDEPGAPFTWNASIKIAKAWEETLEQAATPHTRKVAMRSAMTMSTDRGSVFDVLCRLAKRGLGGTLGSGRQYVSWLHETDFARSVQFLIDREDLSGPINLCAPNPLPQAEFARILRQAAGTPIGLPAAAWMIEIGTWAMRTESELVLKSRRVVPRRLLDAGFSFAFPDWQDACRDLAARISMGAPTRVDAPFDSYRL
ncbi:MAG: TIGR01777 family oxidoreductase [Fimbriimonas sp.]